MSDTTTETKRLTIEDPIDPETLNKFAELEARRMHLGVQMIELETEKVKIMVVARRLEDEKQRLFEKVLVDRGLSPTTGVEIDSNTGKINLIRPEPTPEPPAGG